MAGRRQASVGEDKPSPTKVAAVTAPSKKSERQTAPPAALRPLFFSSPKIEIMFTTGRTQPGVPCRHLFLLPVALCGPLAGRIFTLSGRLLGFLPVYFCVRFSLVFSLSAFGRRARFVAPPGPYFPLVFSSGLARSCCSLRLSSGSSFGLRPRAAAFRSVSVVFRSAGGVRLPSRLPGFWSFFRLFFGSFVVAAPVFSVSFVFLRGFLSFISLVSLSVLFSALFHSFYLGTSVLWLFPYIFLFYFYIFLFVRLSIRGREG